MRSPWVKRVLAVVLCACAAAAAQEIIYVDAAAVGANDGSSWPDAYVSLQDALAAAGSAVEPVEIRVAQGTYHPTEQTDSTSVREATFGVLSGMVLKGGYAGAAAVDPDVRDVDLYRSVLDGAKPDPAQSDRDPFADTVVAADFTDATTVIDGFTITGGGTAVGIEQGAPVVRDCVFDRCWEGAECYFGGNPSFIDCHFNEVSLLVYGCQVSVTRCLFEHVGQWVPEQPVIRGTDGSLVATDCVFRENEDGVIDGISFDLDLLRCSFLDNTSGGFIEATLRTMGDLTARECLFRSNRSKSSILEIAGHLVSLTDCEFADNSATRSLVRILGADVASVTRCSFVGNTGTVLDSYAIVMRLSQCLFTGNTCHTAIIDRTPDITISNCTFAGNRTQTRTIDGRGSNYLLTQCIYRDDVELFDGALSSDGSLTATYSNIKAGYEGQENFDVDPGFVWEGYWADPADPSIEVGPDDPEAVWVAGDYHLQSQAGHWDRGTESWVLDEATSPCIDAGDPNGYLGSEPFPNGGYVNLGAYGGTLEASRSYFGKPVCENQLAGDINGDCIVDQTDMDILLSHWLMDSAEVPNTPPVVRIVSPADGAELTYPDPIEVRVETFDPDGDIWSVSYYLGGRSGTSSQSISLRGDPESDDWVALVKWSDIHLDAVFTLTATARDNQGGKAVSTPIAITVHPQN